MDGGSEEIWGVVLALVLVSDLTWFDTSPGDTVAISAVT